MVVRKTVRADSISPSEYLLDALRHVEAVAHGVHQTIETNLDLDRPMPLRIFGRGCEAPVIPRPFGRGCEGSADVGPGARGGFGPDPLALARKARRPRRPSKP